MTDFASIWNARIPADRKASVIAGVTDDAINDYLAAHRKFDGQRYLVQRVFEDAGQPKLKLTLIVGGNKQAHNAGTAAPLSVAFPAAAGSGASVSAGFRSAYLYPPAHYTDTYDQLAAELPNVVLSARDVNLYMEWPNSAGGSWTHHQGGIDFELEAKVDLLEDDERYSLSFTPVKLHVSQASEAALRDGILRSLLKGATGTLPTGTDPKIADLVMAVVQVAAATVGPELVKNIQVPVFEIGKFNAVPTALAIGDGVVSVAVHLSVEKEAAAARERIAGLKTAFITALRHDIEEAGGVERILYDDATLAKADALPPNERDRFLIEQPQRSEAEVEARLKRVAELTTRELSSLQKDVDALLTRAATSARPTPARSASEGIAVAINEDTFDRLVADIGGTTKSGFTDRESLALIRGRLGYELKLGKPNIDITTAGELSGAIKVDAFAGLYYQVKEVLDCSWRWSREHRIGLGVKGTPRITLTTRKSGGLSIVAKVDLGTLGLQTGLGKLIDSLINLFISPFKKLVELVLNGFLALLSLVVIPAEFRIPTQNTAIKFSRFSTSQYVRHGARSSENNFLLVKCDSAGVSV